MSPTACSLRSAEYRLLLRHDNAAERLAPARSRSWALDMTTVGAESRTRRRRSEICLATGLDPGPSRVPKTDALLEALGTAPLEESQIAARLLRRPQVSYGEPLSLLVANEYGKLRSRRVEEALEQIAIQARYDGYIRRQLAEIRASPRD